MSTLNFNFDLLGGGSPNMSAIWSGKGDINTSGKAFTWFSVALFTLVFFVIHILMTPGVIFAIPEKTKDKTPTSTAIVHSLLFSLMMMGGIFLVFYWPVHTGKVWGQMRGEYLNKIPGYGRTAAGLSAAYNYSAAQPATAPPAHMAPAPPAPAPMAAPPATNMAAPPATHMGAPPATHMGAPVPGTPMR